MKGRLQPRQSQSRLGCCATGEQRNRDEVACDGADNEEGEEDYRRWKGTSIPPSLSPNLSAFGAFRVPVVGDAESGARHQVKGCAIVIFARDNGRTTTMTARSCEEISKELEEMWSLRETLQTPEEQLLMDPKIDGLIDKLKRTCGPTYEETFQSLLARLKT